MNRSSSRALLLGAFVLLLSLGSLPARAAASPGLAAYAEHLLTTAYPADQPGAAALVMKDGQVVLRKGFGMANLELGIPVSPDMVFELGSITKQFTAASILILQERGKLRVEDEITKYLPDYPTHGKKITVENLLTHTSGIPSYTDLEEWMPRVREDMKLTDLIAMFKDKPLEFTPGEKWEYDNSGYILLGAIIEKVSGKSYEQFVEEEIFQKLGMAHSRYGHTEEIIPLRATGYEKNDKGFYNARYLSMTQPYAAGSLMSTVDDLAIWDRALSGETLLKKASLDRMFTSYKIKSGLATHYGYGMGVSELAGKHLLAHGGGIFGFVTIIARVPDERLLVVILSNNEASNPPPEALALRIAAKALGQPLEDRKPVALDAKALDEYVGVYRFDAETVRSISREGTKLFSQRSGGRKAEILASGHDDFYFVDDESRLHFRRDAQGKIEGADMVRAFGPDERGTKTTEAPPKERQAAKVDPAIYDAYVGEYELSPGFSLVITREGGQIFAQATGQQKLELYPESETRFFLKEVDAQVEFQRGTDGKVSGLVLHQGGRNMPGKRK